MRIGKALTLASLAIVILSACGTPKDSTASSTTNPAPSTSGSYEVPDMEPTQATKDMTVKVIGMHEAEAIAAIEAIGDSYRIARRDDEDFALTMDYRPNRINLEIDNNIVSSANIG